MATRLDFQKKKQLSKECPGVGEQAQSGNISIIFEDEDTCEYKGSCPECGRQRPCTGRAIMLSHKE